MFGGGADTNRPCARSEHAVVIRYTLAAPQTSATHPGPDPVTGRKGLLVVDCAMGGPSRQSEHSRHSFSDSWGVCPIRTHRCSCIIGAVARWQASAGDHFDRGRPDDRR